VSKAAVGDERARAHLQAALRRQARVLVSAVTLTEVLRGGPRDTQVHRILKGVTVEDVTSAGARTAGELLGSIGMQATVDAIVAATARAQPGPVLIVTSDPGDLVRLTQDRADVTVAVV
jgi:predicted nucleic acid-binding protein